MELSISADPAIRDEPRGCDIHHEAPTEPAMRDLSKVKKINELGLGAGLTKQE